MNLQFYFLVNVILVSRLLFTDGPLHRWRTILISFIQLAGLLFLEIRVEWWILLILLTAINIAFYFINNNRFAGKFLKNPHFVKLLLLAVQILILNFFFSPGINLSFARVYPIIPSILKDKFLIYNIISIINPVKFNILLLGLLLATNEANIVIRYILSLYNIVPMEKNKEEMQEKVDKEFNAGRIIGILERIIIYYFVLNIQFAAIGFILAAKSFTRFKELDNKQFAEYVLVGTLLSATLAILIAVMVKKLLVIVVIL